ncbi:MAG: hypothetical protein WBX26_07145 [Candidatus Cybelea sp.]
MKNSDFGRRALGICAAAAMLAGCGGPQPPIGAPGTASQTSTLAMRADRDTSWLRRGTSSGSDLLYVANHKGGVYVLTYPQGQLIGELSLPYEPMSGGICSDSDGNIFVPDEYEILEYAHGGTQPIATLSDDGGYGYPNGCAVDPSTGNLAVTNDINLSL